MAKAIIRGSGGGVSSDDLSAEAENVLSGKMYVGSDTDDEAGTGNMPNNGAVSASLNAGQSYAVPKGYHNGSGKVIANSLSSQTSATAAAGDILSGKTGYANGNKLTGTMVNRGAVSASLNAGSSYNIPAGYHNGSGKVSAASLASQTAGNATAAYIESGKTLWVNGSRITGTLVNRGKSVKGTAFKYVNSTYCVISMNEGIYTDGTNQYPEVYMDFAAVRNALGLTADKIKKGVSILGITGTFQGYV